MMLCKSGPVFSRKDGSVLTLKSWLGLTFSQDWPRHCRIKAGESSATSSIRGWVERGDSVAADRDGEQLKDTTTSRFGGVFSCPALDGLLQGGDGVPVHAGRCQCCSLSNTSIVHFAYSTFKQITQKLKGCTYFYTAYFSFIWIFYLHKTIFCHCAKTQGLYNDKLLGILKKIEKVESSRKFK